MLADVMTMREHSDKPISEIKYAYVGDTRSNMGHSLMIVGCLMGMDVRICGPKQLWPSDEYRQDRARAGEEVRRQADHHRRPQGGGQGRRLHPHRRLGVDGRAQGGLEGAHRAAEPYQVNTELMKASGNPHVKFMHCLPAFHDTETKVGKQIAEHLRHDQRARGHQRRVRVASATSPSSRPRTACTPSRRSSSPRWETEPC